MAQHISIINNNIYPKIKENIIIKFSKKNTGLGSLKYTELKDNDYKITSSDRVFINRRIIKGVEETFEIHFDDKKRQILDIFLVK